MRAERDRPLRLGDGRDVAVGGLLRERLGDEVVDRLVEPLLGGVYAGRVDALWLRATMPALAAALDAGAPVADRGRRQCHRRRRSSRESDGQFGGVRRTEGAPSALSRRRTVSGVRRRESARSPGRVAPSDAPAVLSESPALPEPVFGALRGGYATLVDALAAGLDVRRSTTVRALHRLPDGWRLVLGPGRDELDVDAVLLAVPHPRSRGCWPRSRPPPPARRGRSSWRRRCRRARLPGGRRGTVAGDVRCAGRRR